MRNSKRFMFAGLVGVGVASPAMGSMSIWLDFGSNFQSLVDSVNESLGLPDCTTSQITTMESNIQQQLTTLYSGYQINFSQTDTSGARPVYFETGEGDPLGLLGTTPAQAQLGNSDVNPSTMYTDILVDHFGPELSGFTSNFTTYLADYTRAMTNITGHELGHSFGLLHQESYGYTQITPANYANTSAPNSAAGIDYQSYDLIADANDGKGDAELVSPLTTINTWDRAVFDVTGGALESGLSIVNNPVIEVNGTAGHTISAATPLTFSTGETSGLQLSFRRGTLDSSGTDFYKFTTAGPGLFTSELRSLDGVAFFDGEDFQAKLTLFASNGVTPIWTNTNASYGNASFENPASQSEVFGGFDPFLNNIPIPSAGTYYLEVSAAGNFSAGNIYQILSGFNAGVTNPETYVYQHAGGGDANSSGDSYQAWNNLSGGTQANFPADDGAAFAVIGSGGITSTGISNSNIAVNTNYTKGVDELEIDSGNTLTQSSSSSVMIANRETLGYSGSGTYTQSNGTNTVNTVLALGNSATSTGTYNLSGNAILNTNGNVYVGYQGTGVFNQTGDTHNFNYLTVAGNTGSTGTYNFENGTLSGFFIELNANGTFHQSGGSLSFGVFNQTGGTAIFDTPLDIQSQTNYVLKGGSLTASSITAGGTSPMVWTGGSLTLNDQPFDLTDGTDPVYNAFIYGQSLTLNSGMSLTQGDSWEYMFGNGSSLTQNTGSSNTMPYLYMGNTGSGTSADQYNLNGGNLNVYGGFVGYVNAYSGTGAAAITQTGGTATFTSYLNVGYNAQGNYSLSGTGTLQVTGTLSVGTQGTVQVGGGSLTASTTSNAGSISQTGGTSSLGALSGAGTVSVGGGTGPATMSVTQFTQGSITIGSQGLFKLLSNSNFANTVSTLAITGSGQFDLANNHFFVADSGGVSHDATFRNILGWVENGVRANSNGEIISSAGFSGYGVGLVDGNDGVLGTPVSANTIEVAYTLYGDANLDGKVDITDFNIFAPAFGLPTTLGWEAGDFNYSGTVDIGDFNLFAGNFGLSDNGTSLGLPAADYAALDAFAAENGLTLPTSNVPEPASLGLVALGSVGMLAQRRRRSVRETNCLSEKPRAIS